MVSVPKNSYIYPKLQAFETNYDALKQIAGSIPAALQPAYQAIMRSGATIQAHLDDGVTVASDDFDNWLQTTYAFSKHLSAAQGSQTIQKTAVDGQSQPGDSIFSPILQVSHAITTTIEDAWGEVMALGSGSGLPWGWIGLGVATVIVFPVLVGELAPSRRRRRRRRA